jgi:hypothetical protein
MIIGHWINMTFKERIVLDQDPRPIALGLSKVMQTFFNRDHCSQDQAFHWFVGLSSSHLSRPSGTFS